jgi:endonuclease/exonuclease/phosphatase (EEP) superfamily protein YafD
MHRYGHGQALSGRGDRVAAPRYRASMVVRLVVWLCVLPFAVWAAVHLSGVNGRVPLAQLIAFTPYVAALSPIPFLLALTTRRWWAAGLAAVAGLVLVAAVLPRWIADGDALAEATGPRLRVLSANLLAGQADPAAVVALVRDHDIDLLAVQELTPEEVQRLDAAGLAGLLPNRVIDPAPGVVGSGIFTRYRLRDNGVRVNPRGFRQSSAMLFIPGTDYVAVESVHPSPPSPARFTPQWRQGLTGQPRPNEDGVLHVLLGDFNATLDHDVIRDLLAKGYRDAAAVTGDGLAGTWGPYDGDPIPPVAIDHVLADGRVGVRDFSVHAVAGSDHRAILADLVLPRRL